MHDPEVALSLILHLKRRMALEPEQYLQTNSNQARMNRKVQQMSARRNHARQLIQTFLKRNILKRSCRHDKIKRLIRKRQTQEISLRKRHIALASGAVVERLARSHHRRRRQIKRGN